MASTNAMTITSFKDYRTNFKLHGLHYSLGKNNDLIKGYCCLSCKETGKVWGVSFDDYDDIMKPFIKCDKHGATYNQRFDTDGLERFVVGIISGKTYDDAHPVKKVERRSNYILNKINKLQQEIRLLNNTIDLMSLSAAT